MFFSQRIYPPEKTQKFELQYNHNRELNTSQKKSKKKKEGFYYEKDY